MSTRSERARADKPGLSAPCGRSDQDITDATARMIRAIGRRAAASDPDAALLLLQLDRVLVEAFAHAVEGWRRTGYSDAQIGAELGVTKQAVQQRWPRGEDRTG